MIKDEILNQIRSGMTVRVTEKIKEGDKEKISRFEGLVLARKHGKEAGATFTVRSTVAGVGVEKVYPIYSPRISKVEIVSIPAKRPRRSKLYYLRARTKKQTRRKIGTAKEKVAA